jgi:hypothetical protein
MLASLALAIAVPLAAHAGQSCEQAIPEASAVQAQLDMAVKTVERLNASGAEVVIIGRIGQDLSKYHQRYSHIAFAYRDGQDWWWSTSSTNAARPSAIFMSRGWGSSSWTPPSCWRPM